MMISGLETESPVFEVRDVSYRYNRVVALQGLSLTIHAGERVALVGPNGSGKSTLLRILDGLYFAEKGSVLYRGQPLTEEQFQVEAFGFDFRRRVGLVFQSPDSQLFSPSVFDEVAFGPLQLRWPKDQIRRRVAETLDMMEISHLKDRAPHHLSMGEKKRVTLASVLILDPEILLLDEPTAALDPKSESHMIDFLAARKGSGRTVVTTTHDLDIIEDIADTCVVFQSGRAAAQGSPSEILADAPLLERTNLIHAHRHVHPSGEVHAHAHLHQHKH